MKDFNDEMVDDYGCMTVESYSRINKGKLILF